MPQAHREQAMFSFKPKSDGKKCHSYCTNSGTSPLLSRRRHRCLAERLAITTIIRTSDEIKAHLHHGVHELRQVQQLLATVSDRIQTVFDAIQACNARAEDIDPTIDTLNRWSHTLIEEMGTQYRCRSIACRA